MSAGLKVDTRIMDHNMVSLGDSIVKLSVLEARSLGDYLEIHHGIKAPPAPVQDPKKPVMARIAGQIQALVELKGATDYWLDSEDYHQLRVLLAGHLGSEAAAGAWLNATDTGYPGTAMDAIRSGHADLVREDLEAQWGPSPSYA